MSDTSAHPDSGPESAHTSHREEAPSARKELWIRFLYMIAFWFLGNIAFSVAIFLGALQFVVILITGSKNEELRGFSRNLIQYVWECLAFVIFAREDKPFPLGRFPSVTSSD
ncbi:DUF4389 domain-containing protein [Parvibaculum sp.]|jgi:hypothetical protein|uniref:DUF4389 domain-containing protein n=1 Tax=Parvibaculum sp. TaxID=2024848 RepID=UPI000C35AFB2|nr:DUF4389 domain-containing protein [Parvibaculum sp.]HAC59620.1 hypothetical protein [Rhodobiaceae bacterium]MAU60130.1 hypothetical protein [Parvibaculum sp.]MBO6669549.1 DUF4389 domain-containing protein [Parvibaculum sp.]MBO6691996.1 DUF4389 domain-containing protein [Parvibaculum sp.]MBO6715935.1 DUF4389 domain-containing protein [Parvibaculum sp.]|tara:strand:- start:2666 stop:3001 length:336 start_codon:yes stop_codon:yes gene_type:complete